MVGASRGADLKGSPELDWALLARQARHDARARFGDLPDVEDLVQEALVLLWKRQGSVVNPRAWLRATVWRLFANRRRSQQADPLVTLGGDTAAGVANVEARLEIRIGLASAARELTDGERRLLQLLALGHSHRQIGQILGIGWKSVGARVRRMRRKLHGLLDRAPDGR